MAETQSQNEQPKSVGTMGLLSCFSKKMGIAFFTVWCLSKQTHQLPTIIAITVMGLFAIAVQGIIDYKKIKADK